jgi:hypothetical protein
MSLPVSNANFDALAPRGPGQLITSADWNALVAAAKSVQDTLNALSQAVDTRLGAVETSVQTASAELAIIDNAVRQYSRVTLTPSQTVYAVGETALITATLADFAGNPAVFNPASLPWVTFVCTWGRLRAVPGFVSDGAEGDRTVAVQVNAQGIAQVRLQPDHAENFDVGFEDAVATTMTGKVAINNLAAADIIRNSATPATANDAGAFKFLSTEYDRVDTANLRNYVDTWYEKFPTKVVGNGIIGLRQTWQDYRVGVFCFVQNSNDPNTPDFGRAAGSVQVVYRDWIGPWYNLDYSVNTAALVASFKDRLTPKFTNDLTESVTNIRSEVNAIVANQGVLQKQRNYGAVRSALDSISIAQPPAFLNAVSQSVQDAISIQQTLQTVQAKTANVPQKEIAFEVFTNAATQAQTSVASANGAVTAVQQQLTQMQASVTDAQTKVSTLTNSLTAVGARLDTALADSGAVGSLRLQLNTVKNQVGAFAALNPTDVATKIGTLSALNDRVLQLETRK